MKHVTIKTALAALVLCTAALSAAPAHAISYYDDAGRPFYFNFWGQKVYYDTGYNMRQSYYPGTPGVVTTRESTYRYYYPEADPGMAPVQTAYPETVTTYSTQPGENCREMNNTVQVNGEVQSTTNVQCQQPDGSWADQ